MEAEIKRLTVLVEKYRKEIANLRVYIAEYGAAHRELMNVYNWDHAYCVAENPVTRYYDQLVNWIEWNSIRGAYDIVERQVKVYWWGDLRQAIHNYVRYSNFTYPKHDYTVGHYVLKDSWISYGKSGKPTHIKYWRNDLNLRNKTINGAFLAVAPNESQMFHNIHERLHLFFDAMHKLPKPKFYDSVSESWVDM
nr:TPA_asm: hypothetical protein [Candastroli virus 3]